MNKKKVIQNRKIKELENLVRGTMGDFAYSMVLGVVADTLFDVFKTTDKLEFRKVKFEINEHFGKTFDFEKMGYDE